MASLKYIKSKRLHLVAADRSLVQADLDGHATLEKALSVSIPENWPPDLYERTPMEFALQQLQGGARVGWSFWYLVIKVDAQYQLLGICGFKGKPDINGDVEIGYSVLQQFRNKGYATEAVTCLIDWAFTHHHVNGVIAETLPHLMQSIRVLEKNGFQFSGAGSEHGVIRYYLKRRRLD
jgi:ribosomal-protein-alanine N-acetyltransferase